MRLQGHSVHSLWRTFRQRIIGQKFVQDVGALTVANLVEVALTLLQGILVARWLSPEGYGVAALVMSYPDLVQTFFDARSSRATVKYLSQFHACRERARAVAMCQLSYGLDLALILLTFLTIVCTTPWAVEHIVRRPEAAWLLPLYAAAFFPRAIGATSRAVLATLGRFAIMAVLQVVTAGIRVGTVLGLVLAGWGVAGVIWGNVVALTFEGLALGICALGAIRHTWGPFWLPGCWQALRGEQREIVRFMVYTKLHSVFDIFVKQLDILVLGHICHPTVVGHYRLAKTIGNSLVYLVNPLQAVLYPRLAYLWGMQRYAALQQTVRRYAVLVGLPLAVGVLISLPLLPMVIRLLVGEQYNASIASTEVFLVGGAIFLGLFWVRPLALASGEVRFWFLLGAVTGVVALLAYPTGAVLGQAFGLAIAYTVTNGLADLIAMAYVLRIRGITR